MPKSSIINILCYELPAVVAQPMHREYESRVVEIERILGKPGNNYQILNGYESTVLSLLAISLFYRHIFGHILGASEFYSKINKDKETEHPIRIGNGIFNKEEQNRILGAMITFESIRRKFQISSSFFDFSETLQFIRNCKDLFLTPEYEEDNTV